MSEERVRAGGILNPRAVRRLLDSHLLGQRSYYDQLFALIVFQLWQAPYPDDWAERRGRIMGEVDG